MNIVELATEWANECFAGSPDRDAQVTDTISLAWEFARQYGDKAEAGCYVAFAVRRVRAHGDTSRGRKLPMEAVEFEMLQISDGSDPAETAAFRIDFAAWLDTLTPTQLAVVQVLVEGESTKEAAKRLKVSPARISQRRRELEASWQLFTA